ncbi:beta-xylosidase [Alginatibacterium sediminis]|uniref:Beta-xylosidase n=1 Tax=Alginatibacterium sediminis TaxID=2164068 RepID=A0A420EI22_9ALTE|nr:glycoside hydrolase family 52 protein [Alginatibacterium sediminis]RKF20307.1 beta-xylosidase [Alginatibacterium sediminis]
MSQHSNYFHAHHSPMGALASFTLGAQGEQGGLGLELGTPYPGNVHIGYQDDHGTIHQLPFFKGACSQSERYVQDAGANSSQEHILELSQRELKWSSDRFVAQNLELKILSPFFSIPEPEIANDGELKNACRPAVYAQLTVNNPSDHEWVGFFALQGEDLRWNAIQQPGQMVGVSAKDELGLASNSNNVSSFSHFSIASSLSGLGDTENFGLGPCAGLKFTIPAGQSKTIDIVLGVYKEGNATFNRKMQYYYTTHFANLNSVLIDAIENFDTALAVTRSKDLELEQSNLSPDQQFLVAHATHSYYGSTQWLVEAGKSVWVVNEGEYLMMNTLDLTVDMLFFELKLNPWTVKNTLEHFVNHYRYYDKIFSPEEPEQLLEGGVSFTHDMGVSNNWSSNGVSSYEISGLDRICFSHMTYEQLTNWVLCCGVYGHKTQDYNFLKRHQGVLKDCLQSLLNRDHPVADKRNGIMSFESSRTQGGGEITTYDSLDHSLGQARANIYLAGKAWASYLALEQIFTKLGDNISSVQAKNAALMSSELLSNSFDETLGFIPAVLENGNQSAIIPAVEALVYPYEMGLFDAVDEKGPYGAYVSTLKRHLQSVLDSGICLYPDGAWKLSSTADNSWASKIFLNQYVARQILGLDLSNNSQLADNAHVRWQQIGAAASACCDQFSSGKPIGSLYYPRCVSNILWMQE